MLKDFQLTSYDYYSNRRDMEIISSIVDSLKKILEEDSKQEQPLFLKISDNLIMNIARKVVQEKKRTFVIPVIASAIMAVVTIVIHLLFELFAGESIATIIALLLAVVTYGASLVLLGGVTEEEMLEMPKGTTLISLCRKLHLIRGEYR